NRMGCAADSNTCTSSTCGDSGGIGPCATWGEITARWGTTAPRLRQSTTVTLLSNLAASDSVAWDPQLELGSTAALVGTATTVCTGTLSGVVAKSRSTQQLLNATLCAGTAADEWVCNSTRGSCAWTHKSLGANAWSLSQPLPAQSIPWNGTDPGESDTWANGDAFTVATFASAPIVRLSSSIADFASGAINGVYLQHVAVAPATTAGAMRLGAGAAIIESSLGRYLSLSSAISGNPNFAINVDAELPIEPDTAQFFFNQAAFKAGILRQGFVTGISMTLEAGVILGGSGAMNVNGQDNDVYVDSTATLGVTGTSIAAHYPGQAIPYIWGPGTVSVAPPGVLAISAATAAPSLLVTNVRINGQSTACSASNAASPALTCGITVSGANIDSHGGVLFDPLGASISTTSSPF
ncbi:MAG TPA: hypothetical protein VGR59_09590, partial [Gemmatimonadaceae bacterium]|nr:hypothetical protein [Gemmatimonadaceae bacterium]